VKTCTSCKQTLDESKFHVNFDNRKNVYRLRAECKECGKARKRKYVAKNKHKEKEWNRNNYLKNRENIIAKQKEWNSKNRDKRALWWSDYYQKNKDAFITRARNRRMLLLNSPGSFTNEGIALKIELQGGCCYYCKAPLGEDMELDHKIPVSRGGTNFLSNIAPSCRACNHLKRDKPFMEFVNQPI